MARSPSKPELQEDEDLFDFAGLKDELASNDADELDVEQFLAAVGAAMEDERADRGLGVSESVLREVESLQQASLTPVAKPSPAPAPPPPIAPAAAPLAPVSVTVGGGLPRPVWIAGLALLGLNALGLGLTLLRQQHSASELEAARQRLEQAAAGVGEGLREEIQRFERGTAQAASAALESGVSLGHVERSLADRDFHLARRQLYARANFMLADSYRLEGEARLAEESKP
jgi:hypothetical protein